MFIKKINIRYQTKLNWTEISRLMQQNNNRCIKRPIKEMREIKIPIERQLVSQQQCVLICVQYPPLKNDYSKIKRRK